MLKLMLKPPKVRILVTGKVHVVFVMRHASLFTVDTASSLVLANLRWSSTHSDCKMRWATHDAITCGAIDVVHSWHRISHEARRTSTTSSSRHRTTDLFSMTAMALKQAMKNNFNKVREFIKRRSNKPLKDQLHAIWLSLHVDELVMTCWWKVWKALPWIPHAGGRLLETGTEQFLALKREGKLGNSTLIGSYFTAQRGTYLCLSSRCCCLYQIWRARWPSGFDIGSSLNGLSEDDIKERFKNGAETKLQEVCIGPLKIFSQSDIPHVAVSSEYRYSYCLVCV